MSLPLAPPLEEHNDIPYVSGEHADPLHKFDLYIPKSPTVQQQLPLIIFVHGGAWRSEDKADHADLARRLAAWSSYPVAVPNYRLTTPTSPHKHPTHAQDLVRFLHFLLSWEGPGSAHTLRSFDPSRLYILGHSCSAHMLTSIFLDVPQPSGNTNTNDVSPFPPALLVPSAELLRSTRGIVMSEGIYDLDLLLRSFPSYKAWFVADAFGNLESYDAFNTLKGTIRPGAEHIRWLIIHSSGDTLVDQIQSDSIYAHLLQESGQQDTSSSSEPINTDTLNDNNNTKVHKDCSLSAEHDQILREEGYPEIVSRFVLAK